MSSFGLCKGLKSLGYENPVANYYQLRAPEYVNLSGLQGHPSERPAIAARLEFQLNTPRFGGKTMRAAICARMNSSNVLRWVAIASVLWPIAMPHAQPVPADQEAPRKGAPAAEPSDPKKAALRADYDSAFKATMDKPADPAVLLHFAKIAVEFGDIEGAISALERLLLIDGDQPEVKLELGVLYYRLGSIETAQAYLKEARDSDSATDDIRKRADTFLKEGVKAADIGKR